MAEPVNESRYNIWDVSGFTVTLGNSSILFSEHRRDGAAHNIASAYYNCIGTRDGYASGFQETDDCRRGAWGKQRIGCARGKVSNVVSVETRRIYWMTSCCYQ